MIPGELTKTVYETGSRPRSITRDPLFFRFLRFRFLGPPPSTGYRLLTVPAFLLPIGYSLFPAFSLPRSLVPAFVSSPPPPPFLPFPTQTPLPDASLLHYFEADNDSTLQPPRTQNFARELCRKLWPFRAQCLYGTLPPTRSLAASSTRCLSDPSLSVSLVPAFLLPTGYSLFPAFSLPRPLTGSWLPAASQAHPLCLHHPPPTLSQTPPPHALL